MNIEEAIKILDVNVICSPKATEFKKAVEVITNELNRQKAEIEKYQHIKTTINEFWDILLKLSLAKRKEEPTLEELAEAITEIEAGAIKEFWNRMRTEIDDSRYKVVTDTYYARTCNDVIDYCILKGDNLVKEMEGVDNEQNTTI